MMRDALKIIQANLHRAKCASAILSRRFATEDISLGLIQEPWAFNGGVRGLQNKACKLVYAAGERPRAVILINSKITFFPITEFITRDLVAVSVKLTTDVGVREVICASAYFPGDLECVPPLEVQNFIRFCREKSHHFIIGCDANAHHEVWGSTDNNDRGEYLLDFLISNNVAIVNRGSRPTFVNAIRSEVLDITLCDTFTSNLVRDWHVSDEVSLSDHMHIRFDLASLVRINNRPTISRKVNWTSFRENVAREVDWLPDSVGSVDELDLAAGQLQSTIKSSLDSSVRHSDHTAARRVPWWNDTLAKMRKTVRRDFNRAKRTGEWQIYRDGLTKYNKEIRRSKRETWRGFCQSVEGLPALARLQKSLTVDHSNGIGSLSTGTGGYTQSRRQTLDLLMGTHFPGSREAAPVRECWDTPAPVRVTKRIKGLAGRIFTPDRVLWAIGSFKPYKAPGRDGIFPALLQRSSDIILSKLIVIFKASFGFGYIPRAWREVTVIFIPKAGRPSDLPKSYRPISLSSFLLKTMERLIDVYIRETCLVERPLHPNQFAYVRGGSTEGAILSLLEGIGKAYSDREVALCAFLDIQGAFDNTGFDSIAGSLYRRGVEGPIIAWIESMLRGRVISSSLDGEELTVMASKGCPQGGVLSPLLWTVVVDDLLAILSQKGIGVIGYADDLVLMIRGKFETTLRELMADALRDVSAWCSREGLSVNPSKTVVVPFTKRYKLTCDCISFMGTTIIFSKEVKYLGVILDRRLNWNSHICAVQAKATRALWACRSSFGRTWGLSPRMTLWIYTAIIRPMITYAALAWWKKTEESTTMRKLGRVQRLACLGVTGAMRTCPTAALEALIGLTPLHIYVMRVAACSAARTFVRTPRNESRNLAILHRVVRDPISVLDAMPLELCFGKRFKVEVPDRECWSTGYLVRNEFDLNWYTDGSKMDSGVGAGVYGPNRNLSIPLGKSLSVFQAEVLAITACAEINLDIGLKGKTINIFSDSQAALKALDSHRMTSRLVKYCYDTLQKLSLRNRVRLFWVPGHCGISGNEKADALARKGSATPYIGPEPCCAAPLSTILNLIDEWETGKCLEHWNSQSGLRHAKAVIRPCFGSKSDVLKFRRPDLKILTDFLTGHCSVRAHLMRMAITDTDVCRLCSQASETAEHILCECVALDRFRWMCLGRHMASLADISTIKVSDLLVFIRKAVGLLNRQ